MVLLLVENELQLRNERSIFWGGGELKRKEAERIFELVFNFSVLTTARLLEGYIDNESMF